MRLNTILKKLGLNESQHNYKIKHFTRKYEDIRENTLFFSFKPISFNEFLELKEKGVVYVIGESSILNNDYQQTPSILKSYQKMLLIENKHKLKNKVFIGVTGTNGKTTISTHIYNILNKQAIYYGSNGIYTNGFHYMSNNTTPSMEILFKHLNNQKYVIMEISSISFYEYRLFGIKFDYIILTNIEEEHLEYHNSFEDYKYTKYLILASNFDSKVFISETIKDRSILRLNQNTYTYGMNSNLFQTYLDKDELLITTKFEQIRINVKNELRYNILNMLGTISLLYEMGISLEKLERYFNNKEVVSGRFEQIKYQSKTIIIDYPHTISAYKELFKSLLEKYNGNIITIFGAGGERAKNKRTEYAKIVSKYSKFAILTNDNPRSEPPSEIIDGIIKGISIPYIVSFDRKEAIKIGLSKLNEYNILLVLGKGNEEYIDMGDHLLVHNDIKYIKELIND